MIDLTTVIKHFASLNRAPGPTWTDATKRKAPHKPLLLLAMLDLVDYSANGPRPLAGTAIPGRTPAGMAIESDIFIRGKLISW